MEEKRAAPARAAGVLPAAPRTGADRFTSNAPPDRTHVYVLGVIPGVMVARRRATAGPPSAKRGSRKEACRGWGGPGCSRRGGRERPCASVDKVGDCFKVNADGKLEHPPFAASAIPFQVACPEIPEDIVELPQTGGCICGAVRYEITQAPVSVYTCCERRLNTPQMCRLNFPQSR